MRNAILLIIGLHITMMSSCQETTMEKYSNHLVTQTSPYLLQHAHNPVNWYPWTNEALELAKKENKLIIVSIGYAACHWCHVMEHESFEDTTVANLMNKYYISIKVDREERPDVDQVYMDAANIMTGRGGWPLNVIALPDGRPIYAGTYFPKDQWMQVLQGVQDFYIKSPEKALEQAMQVASGVSKMNILANSVDHEFSSEILINAAKNWTAALDDKEGGRRGAMKFPMPKSYLALLNYAVVNKDSKARELVILTLDKMAKGGIYDQLGGGFSRYSVDPYWHVPHFEKMLYDNAQLLTLYSEAYKLTENSLYKSVVEQTIEFADRELKSPENAYYSSLDADSEGEEGKYYAWTKNEIDELLDSESGLFNAFYGVTKNGNWEAGNNVLKIDKNLAEVAEMFNLTEHEAAMSLEKSRKLLFGVRAERIRPALDDKVLTSWNGLMVTGLSHAYQAFGNESYRDKAIQTGEFLWNKMWNGDALFRNRKNEGSTINGFLDDYSYTIMGFIDLYEITFDEKWLKRADQLTTTAIASFYDKQEGVFYFNSTNDDPLYVRKAVIEDNVIPSGNSGMALNLFKLGHLLYKDSYLEMSKKMLSIAVEPMAEHASFYYNWFDLYQLNLAKLFEVAIVGKDYDAQRKMLEKEFLPNTIMLGGKTEGSLDLLKSKYVDGKTKIYVCVDKTCQLPVEEAKLALQQIN